MSLTLRIFSKVAHLLDWDQDSFQPGDLVRWDDAAGKYVGVSVNALSLQLGAASGTVTSVGISAPSGLFASGAPITTSGNLALTLLQQTAGTVFAGPVGVDGAPSFRPIAASDLPTLPATKVTGVLRQAPALAADNTIVPTTGVTPLTVKQSNGGTADLFVALHSNDTVLFRVTSAGYVAADGRLLTNLDPAALSAAVPVSKGGTGLTAVPQGAVLAGGASGVTAISPNTSTTKRYLAATGDGTTGGIPFWDTVAGGGGGASDAASLTYNPASSGGLLSGTNAQAAIDGLATRINAALRPTKLYDLALPPYNLQPGGDLTAALEQATADHVAASGTNQAVAGLIKVPTGAYQLTDDVYMRGKWLTYDFNDATVHPGVTMPHSLLVSVPRFTMEADRWVDVTADLDATATSNGTVPRYGFRTYSTVSNKYGYLWSSDVPAVGHSEEDFENYNTFFVSCAWKDDGNTDGPIIGVPSGPWYLRRTGSTGTLNFRIQRTIFDDAVVISSTFTFPVATVYRFHAQVDIVARTVTIFINGLRVAETTTGWPDEQVEFGQTFGLAINLGGHQFRVGEGLNTSNAYAYARGGTYCRRIIFGVRVGYGLVLFGRPAVGAALVWNGVPTGGDALYNDANLFYSYPTLAQSNNTRTNYSRIVFYDFRSSGQAQYVTGTAESYRQAKVKLRFYLEGSPETDVGYVNATEITVRNLNISHLQNSYAMDYYTAFLVGQAYHLTFEDVRIAYAFRVFLSSGISSYWHQIRNFRVQNISREFMQVYLWWSTAERVHIAYGGRCFARMNGSSAIDLLYCNIIPLGYGEAWAVCPAGADYQNRFQMRLCQINAEAMNQTHRLGVVYFDETYPHYALIEGYDQLELTGSGHAPVIGYRQASNAPNGTVPHVKIINSRLTTMKFWQPVGPKTRSNTSVEFDTAMYQGRANGRILSMYAAPSDLPESAIAPIRAVWHGETVPPVMGDHLLPGVQYVLRSPRPGDAPELRLVKPGVCGGRILPAWAPTRVPPDGVLPLTVLGRDRAYIALNEAIRHRAQKPAIWWPFTETSGTTYTNQGTETVAATTSVAIPGFRGGPVGGAMYFDGGTNYATGTMPTAMRATQSLSMSFWLCMASPSTEQVFFVHGAGRDQCWCKVVTNTASQIRLAFNCRATASTERQATFTFPTTPWTWFHVAATYSYPDGKVLVWVNGAKPNFLAHSTTGSWSPNPFTQPDTFAFGRDIDGSRPATGAIANFRIMRGTLTPEDVVVLYNAGRGFDPDVDGIVQKLI